MAHPNEHARHYELPPEPRVPSTPECREAISQLYVYLDGELTEERRVKVQHHLDHCGSCLEAFEFEAELRAVIAERAREKTKKKKEKEKKKRIFREGATLNRYSTKLRNT
jgi:mycothiol system anti-sigma-R factor